MPRLSNYLLRTSRKLEEKSSKIQPNNLPRALHGEANISDKKALIMFTPLRNSKQIHVLEEEITDRSSSTQYFAFTVVPTLSRYVQRSLCYL